MAYARANRPQSSVPDWLGTGMCTILRSPICEERGSCGELHASIASRTARMRGSVGRSEFTRESTTRTVPGARVDMHIQCRGSMCTIWTPGDLSYGAFVRSWKVVSRRPPISGNFLWSSVMAARTV